MEHFAVTLCFPNTGVTAGRSGFSTELTDRQTSVTESGSIEWTTVLIQLKIY